MPVTIARYKWILADLLAVVVFVLIGTRNHHEDTNAGGTFGVLLPFAIAVVVAWVPWRLDADALSTKFAARVWLITVVIGVLLRRFAWDRSTAGTFVIVATAFLFAAFNGWRAVARKLQTR